MSNMKQTQEELVVKKAKYRVKNGEGKYEVVYLETSADQVETDSERQFVTEAERLNSMKTQFIQIICLL